MMTCCQNHTRGGHRKRGKRGGHRKRGKRGGHRKRGKRGGHRKMTFCTLTNIDMRN